MVYNKQLRQINFWSSIQKVSIQILTKKNSIEIKG